VDFHPAQKRVGSPAGLSLVGGGSRTKHFLQHATFFDAPNGKGEIPRSLSGRFD